MIYSIDKSKIIYENYDDETVLINLESGNYYSMNQTSFEVLDLIEKKTRDDKIIEYFVSKYKSSQETARLIREFLELLLSEGLIFVEVSDEGTHTLPSYTSLGVVELIPPNLEKYDDMQSLLLLDPIHEVDETGWPKHKKADEE